MIRTLFIIAGAALVLCMVTLGGAIALGGHDLQRHGWAWTIKDRDGESIRFERIKSGETDGLGPFTTRTLAWTGGEALTIDSSIDVEYVQGPANTVVITGPKGLTDRVTLTDGRLSLGDGDERIVFGWDGGNFSARSDRDELRVVVTAPNVRRFASNGSGDPDIHPPYPPPLSPSPSPFSPLGGGGAAQSAVTEGACKVQPRTTFMQSRPLPRKRGRGWSFQF